MKHYIFIITALTSLFLIGCSASGPKYSGEVDILNNKDNIYIYRPDRFLSSAVSPGVYVDEEYMGSLENGGYLKLNVADGKHTLRVGQTEILFSTKDHSKAFFKYTAGWSLFMFIPLAEDRLLAVDEKLALNELSKTSLSLHRIDN